MSYLGIRTIDPRPGGFDQWSFSHAQHHNDVTNGLNEAVQPTGDTQNNSRLIQNLLSTKGIFQNMAVSGSGIPAGATVIGVDPIALNMTISVPATATAAGVTLTIGYQPLLPLFVLDPVDLTDAKQFLLDHQLSHNAINTALGTSGNDLQDLDWKDEAQVRAWLDLDFTEHQTWMQVTGIV